MTSTIFADDPAFADRDEDTSGGFMKMLFAIFSWGAMFIAAFTIFPAFLPNWLLPNEFAKFGLFILLLALTIQGFLVAVPEVTGLVMLNYLGGKLRSVGPGIHFRYPWERVSEKNFFNLELITEKFEEDYASGDVENQKESGGPMMHAKALYQYRPNPERLARYVKVNDSTIKLGFKGLASSFLSEEISNREAEAARREIDQIQKAVMAKLDGKTPTAHPVPPSTEERFNIRDRSPKGELEELYGVDFVAFTLEDLDFEESYQKARTSKANMQQVSDAVDTLVGKDKTITRKEALNAVLLDQKKAEKKIIEIEGVPDWLEKAVGSLVGRNK